MLKVIIFAVVSLGINIGSFAQASEPQLGTVSFPTSGSKAAQQHFIRGVAALHSFWYTEALSAFEQSTKNDPDFVMGYWGLAMAHNHPLWEEQNTEAAKAALEKIKNISK